MISTEIRKKFVLHHGLIHLECVDYLIFCGCFQFVFFSFCLLLKSLNSRDKFGLIFNSFTLMEIFDDFISDKLHFWPKLSALHNSISFYQSDKHGVL